MENPAKRVPLSPTRTREARARKKIAPAFHCIAALFAIFLWAASAHALDVAGIHTLDLSHYTPDMLHSEAHWSSKNNGIVIIAYADFKNGQQYCHLAAPQVKAGALVRAVFAVGPAPGKTYDIYYNGASMVRANGMRFQPVENFSKALASVVELQALDLRIAAHKKEIEDLDRKSKAIDRVLDLAKDPDLNK